MIRVLLADDQALVRAGFASLLATQDDIEVVGEAADGAEAVRQARTLVPDVVLSFAARPGHVTGFLGPNGAGNPVTELRHSLLRLRLRQ